MWALYLAALLLALPLWSTVALYRNHRRATPIGLPLLISPIDPFNPLWILLRPYVNPLLSCLPYGLGSFTRYDYLGWVWHDKNQLHRIHGPAFVIVTPGQNHLIVGDAAACNDIFKRWREVVKNPAFNDSLNIFGHNVGTAAGNDWQRQRKTTAVAFNEHNNGLVWSEAIKQASQMLSTWVAAGNNGTTSVVEDTNLFALHILTCAGFGLSYDFDSSMNQVAEGHTMTYRDALKTMLGNIFITFAVSSVKIPPFLLPQKAKSILTAIDELKRYMAEMIQAESIAYQNKAAAKSPNLMSTLIRASKQAEQESSNVDKGRNSLTDDEIRGNLFIFNVAGFDTTAGTIAYAIALFACYPQWQEWVREEFVQVFGGAAITDCQYQQCFPQLKRCLAVMYETLRLYAPLNGIPRYTGESHVSLQIGSTLHSIPPNTAVFVNNAGLQSDRTVWGDDTLLWRPDRWLRKEDGSKEETSVSQPEDSFIPWAAGPRVCPGKKFSQVQFVAAIVTVLRNHRVSPVCTSGESEEEARHRIMRVIQDSDMALAMRVNHPEELAIKWERIM